ncbi:Uncharacterised protein [Escherichia coli]|nr:Uncharacterised protein [Escherichia coli]
MTITKQRVEEIISRIEMYGHGAGYTADEDDSDEDDE